MTTMRGPESNMARVVMKSSVSCQADEVQYWLSVPMPERVAAVEVLRQRMFGGQNGTRQGLQRVCRIIHRT